MYLVERSDTSCGVYPRAMFMTVFTLPPEAIIQGRLLQGPHLLTNKLWYTVTTTKEHQLVILST